MATEIELKVWIDDVSYMENRLNESMVYTGEYIKRDEYWTNEALDMGNGIRLREENEGPCIVNWKRKEIRGDIEVNDEHEFSVSSRSELERLLADIGFHPWIRKIKRGKAFRKNSILAELSNIEGLGSFLELEILTDTDDEACVSRARDELYRCLDFLRIEHSKIETRYYTDMLKNK